MDKEQCSIQYKHVCFLEIRARNNLRNARCCQFGLFKRTTGKRVRRMMGTPKDDLLLGIRINKSQNYVDLLAIRPFGLMP